MKPLNFAAQAIFELQDQVRRFAAIRMSRGARNLHSIVEFLKAGIKFQLPTNGAILHTSMIPRVSFPLRLPYDVVVCEYHDSLPVSEPKSLAPNHIDTTKLVFADSRIAIGVNIDQDSIDRLSWMVPPEILPEIRTVGAIATIPVFRSNDYKKWTTTALGLLVPREPIETPRLNRIAIAEMPVAVYPFKIIPEMTFFKTVRSEEHLHAEAIQNCMAELSSVLNLVEALDQPHVSTRDLPRVRFLGGPKGNKTVRTGFESKILVVGQKLAAFPVAASEQALAPASTAPADTSGAMKTHASPRAHDRRGHWRTYKPTAKREGFRLWINNMRVGEHTQGAIEKTYQLRPSSLGTPI